MSDILLNGPPSAAADRPASDVADWLGGLLESARDRGDAPLARLIAGVVDDLRAVGRG